VRAPALMAGGVSLAVASVATPDVPWWGQLIMALVATALAYFGGLSRSGGGT